MPVGDRQPTALLMEDETWQREPIRLAEEMGHDVYNDTCCNERYTCRRCDRAVLRVGCNIYGSAVTERCKGEK